MDKTTTLNSKINEDFWFNKLAAFDAELKAYSDTEQGAVRASMTLGEDAYELVQKISQGNWHSQMTIGLMAYQVLLKKYLYHQSIISVVTDHNGMREGGKLYFDNSDVTSKTVREVLSGLGESVQESLDHKAYREEQLNEKLEANGIDQQLFQQFNLVFANGSASSLSQLADEKAVTTLVIENTEEAFQLTFFSSHQAFSAVDPEKLLKLYGDLIYKLLSNPAKALNEIPLLSDARELEQILKQGKGPEWKPTHNNIFEFGEHLEVRAEQTAVVHEGLEISYKEFDESVLRLAAYFKETGVSKGTPVGVYLENSSWSVIACFAIMKAGGVYLPLDPNDPFERTLFKARDAGASLVIMHSSYLSNFISSGLKPFAIDIQLDTLEEPGESEQVDIQPADIAYVMYTSGSTGEPKGARVTHEDLLNLVQGLIRDCAYKEASEIRKVALVASIGFDPSIQQIMSTLLQKHTLVVVPESVKVDGHKLLAFLNKSGLDRTDMTPSHLRLIVEAMNNDSIGLCLKQIWIGGEALSRQLVDQFNQLCNQQGELVELVNLYGLTETAVDVTAHRAGQEEGTAKSIPIGRPLTNREVLLLDTEGQITPLGGIGELAIGLNSKEVYFKKELNDAHIVKHPLHGDKYLFATGDLCNWKDEHLYYLERKDEQIKLNGVRIEPSEIEMVLKKHRAVSEAVVLKDHEEEVLTAYVVTSTDLEKEKLDAHVKAHLPRYMRPAQFFLTKKIPLTTNGKADKAELLKLRQEGASADRNIVPPATESEERVLRIWAEVLDKSQEGISTDDNFFVLGGNSLKAAKVVYQLFKQHQIDADIEDLFTHPTVSQLALSINQNSDLIGITQAPEQQYYPTTTAQNRIWMDCKVDDTRIAYNMPYAIEVIGDLDPSQFFIAIDLLIARNEILRTVFSEVDGLPRQFVKTTLNGASGFHDITDDKEQEKVLRERVALDFQRVFNLEDGPLFHFAIYQAAKQRFILSFVMHHIIGDGWTIQLLLNKIFEIYDQLNDGTIDYMAKPVLQYKDYAVWIEQHLADMQDKEQFWQETLKNVPELNLFNDTTEGAAESFSGGSQITRLEADLAMKVKQYATKHGMSDNLVIMTAYAILLQKYSFQTDFVVGYPVSGRIHPDSHDLMGCFVNMLPVRIAFNLDDSFEELLQKTEQNLKSALQYQEVPYEEILQSVNKIRESPLKSLFDAVFLGQNEFDSQGIKSTLSIKDYPVPGIKVSHFKLMLSMFTSTEYIEVDINYRDQFFDGATVKKMLNQIGEILYQALEKPSISLKDIQLANELVSSSKLSDVDLTEFEF